MIVLLDAGLVQAAAGLAGAAGRTLAFPSPELVEATWTTQLDAASTAGAITRQLSTAASISGRRGSGEPRGSRSLGRQADRRSVGSPIDQLVQESVAGVVVDVAAPPVAVTPVSAGQ